MNNIPSVVIAAEFVAAQTDQIKPSSIPRDVPYYKKALSPPILEITEAVVEGGVESYIAPSSPLPPPPPPGSPPKNLYRSILAQSQRRMSGAKAYQVSASSATPVSPTRAALKRVLLSEISTGTKMLKPRDEKSTTAPDRLQGRGRESSLSHNEHSPIKMNNTIDSPMKMNNTIGSYFNKQNKLLLQQVTFDL